MKRYVIGVAVDAEREGKQAWMEYHFISSAPAGVGRSTAFATGYTAGTERVPGQWIQAMPGPGVYDIEYQAVQSQRGGFLRLVAVEYCGPLPAELAAALLAMAAPKSA